MEQTRPKNRTKMLWGRALGGVGVCGLAAGIAAQLVAMNMRCIDVGCMVAGFLSMAAGAGALLSAVTGGVGFSLLQSSGYGFDIDWRSGRTWRIITPVVIIVPGLWLSPWILYFLEEGTTLLWVLRAGACVIALVLIRAIMRGAGAERQNMSRIGVLLCLLLASVVGLLSLQSRRCSSTVLPASQYLCWGTDFSGRLEWHTYVAPYSIADNYAQAQGMEQQQALPQTPVKPRK